MAILSSDGKYVTVVSGDTLWAIAEKYLGDPLKYKQLAAINKSTIPNPDLIYPGQKVYLTSDGSSVASTSNGLKIIQFGELSTDPDTLFATWSWSKEHTESYKVLWTYDVGDGIERQGTNTNNTVDKDAPALARQSTYSIPDGARKVYFKVKPIAEKEKDSKNNTEKSYWEQGWSEKKTYTNATPLSAPSTPNVTIKGTTLTATLDNVNIVGANSVVFEVIKNNAYLATSAPIAIVTGHVSYSCTIKLGDEYRVRCRAYNTSNKLTSDWSAYSNNVATIPAAPAGITSIRATSETSIYLEWTAVPTAETYEIEYATKKEYFDNTDQTTNKTGIELTHFEFIGIESGTQYFFRVRAVNKEGESEWTEIKDVIIGEAPAAPTTWSSTTTAIVGEPLNLYWVHNSLDGSSQTYAEIEFTYDGVLQQPTEIIKNTASEDEKDKTSTYSVDTSQFVEGMQIQWRVRTAGIALDTADGGFGEWSTMRVIDIYAKPTLQLSVIDGDGNSIGDLAGIQLSSFPFYVNALAGPKTQVPIGYHVTITSNQDYETVDTIGNPRTVHTGEALYSKYFDTFDELMVEFTPGNVDLANSMSYTVTCVVSMDSGLTAEESHEFTVAWTELLYEPNAEISIDMDAMTATIRPYCVDTKLTRYRVGLVDNLYRVTDEVVEFVYGEVIRGARTTTGELVYSGITGDGEELYYCEKVETSTITDVFLSVYRREYDGKFTELGTGLDGAINTAVTDPHPALDYARYRIVATSKTTGAVSFYDLPGHPVGCTSIIVQWNEEWSDFDVSIDEILVQPNWAGSLLKLPYNIDVTESNSPEVSFIKYIGREHPVSYYGTHLGETATWNAVIPKSDKETIYALRRLSKWTGDVYIREPSGVGYWANVKVSAPIKHLDMTVSVTLTITRVEGGA